MNDDQECDLGKGRPDDRFQAPVAERAAPHEQVVVSVIATVNVTSGEGKIHFVNPLAGGRISGVEPQSQVSLRVKRADGEILQEFPVLVNLYSELSSVADREGLVDAAIPISPETRALELIVAKNVVDSVSIGEGPLLVRGIQHVTAQGKDLLVTLALDKELPHGHTFSVQVSTNRGKTWQTVGVGLKEPIFAIDRAQFREGDEVQVRVLATNGLSSAILAGQPFRL
jgi:hypothetical protein